MLTTALRPSSNCELCTPSSFTHSPPLLLVASTTSFSPSACTTFVLNDVLSSTHGNRFAPVQLFTHGRGPVLAPGSPTVRKRKPRRLRQERAVGVAIMISHTRGLWHTDMIRSATARPRGAKSATGVLGLVLTRWRMASTDAGRNEALGLLELECRRLLGDGSRRRVPCCPWTRTTSMQTKQQMKQILGRAATRLKKSGPVKVKTHKLES